MNHHDKANGLDRPEEVTMGAALLDKLGLSHLANIPLGRIGEDGQELTMQNFPELCGPHAGMVFRGFLEMDESDPDFPASKSYLFGEVIGYAKQYAPADTALDLNPEV